jgi:hypothetical protein
MPEIRQGPGEKRFSKSGFSGSDSGASVESVVTMQALRTRIFAMAPIVQRRHQAAERIYTGHKA